MPDCSSVSRMRSNVGLGIRVRRLQYLLSHQEAFSALHEVHPRDLFVPGRAWRTCLLSLLVRFRLFLCPPLLLKGKGSHSVLLHTLQFFRCQSRDAGNGRRQAGCAGAIEDIGSMGAD